MKHQVSELTGALLDAAMAICLGWMTRGTGEPITDAAEWVMPNGMRGVEAPPAYSTDWAAGGPIIQRERIELEFSHWETLDWTATARDATGQPKAASGATALIAAARAFVRAKLGDEVDLAMSKTVEQEPVNFGASSTIPPAYKAEQERLNEQARLNLASLSIWKLP